MALTKKDIDQISEIIHNAIAETIDQDTTAYDEIMHNIKQELEKMCTQNKRIR